MVNQRNKDRRAQADRRQTDRRRQSDARFAVFEVCRSTLNLALVVRGAEANSDKLVTRSVRWRREAASLHSEIGVQELSDAFRTLVSDERLSGTRARITLSGEFCVTRVITGPTEDVRREFAELEERTLRYLTLGPGRKALSGSIQQLDARHQHALLAVANQKVLDVLMKIAESANIQIEAIEPSLIALGRSQAHLRSGCEEACLIIQLDEGGAELGISHHGRLLLDYRPGGHVDAEHVADVVAQHMSRLQRYLQRYHSYIDMPLRHVYLTGELAAVERAKQKFAQLKQFEVHVLDPADLDIPWQHSGEAPGTNMAAALGTAMLIYPSAAQQQGPNLIESTLAAQRQPLRPILIRSLLPMAAVLLVAATLGLLVLRERGATNALQAELDVLSPARVRATELRLQLIAAEGKLEQLRHLEERLPRPDWQQLLSRISQSMPDDVWLDRATFQDGQAGELTGASYTDAGVYAFVNYLKDVPDIAEIALEGTGVGHTNTGPATSFDLQLTLAAAAPPVGSEDRHD